jgi:hypothetical protein
VQRAVDQQPCLQGYEAVDALWLDLVNSDTLGGGQAVLTGPSFIDASNVAAVASPGRDIRACMASPARGSRRSTREEALRT